MKTVHVMSVLQRVAIAFLTVIAGRSLGQNSTLPPIQSLIPSVTIQATDARATWSGNPGVFTVVRSGNPEPALNVYYAIGGSALNGVDYQSISQWAQIPSGVRSAEIVIKPIDRSRASSLTVVLTLTNSPMMGPSQLMPINYTIGNPSTATVDITVGALTNLPPTVSLLFPTNGALFYTPLNLSMVACAKDADGLVKSVEFLADGKSLGIVSSSANLLPATPGPLLPMPPYRPFVLVWSNSPVGSHVLTVKATDNGGATATSDPVNITVTAGPPPTPVPPTNWPPVVRLTSPADGASFRAPVQLPLYAYAADKEGFVTGVEFFAGTNDLGPGQRVSAIPPSLPPGPIQPPILMAVSTNYWGLIWSNVPQGTYSLTAVATDNSGAASVSAAINVTILPPLPPPPPSLTNLVNIVALDPIAIGGTNCWPWLGVVGATPSWGNWTASTAVCRYFTNCGPKNALFEVQRFGQTNNDLTVAYDVGGTATNGVDYVTLPGTVLIPSGHRAALITVIPLDDGPPDITRSVILKLTPSASYRIGSPPSAAAIILDAQAPRPFASILPEKNFHLSTTGPDGAWFHVEYTTDLLKWTSICTNQVIHGTIDFIDPDVANSVRFYRTVPEAGPPQ